MPGGRVDGSARSLLPRRAPTSQRLAEDDTRTQPKAFFISIVYIKKVYAPVFDLSA